MNVIYFIAAPEADAIKIGLTNDPWRRVAMLQTGSPVDLELLAFEAGDETAERALHKRFASDRMRGEWFRPSAALRAHIATLPAAIRPKREAGVKSFAEAAGISVSYASMILSGARVPRLDRCISIYQKTGRKIGPLARASDHDLALLATIQVAA